MKILHTADWHLGQKFLQFDRAEEHQYVLNWLIELIQKENIDLLIIAGDIFDITSPPNYAVKLYYNFFKALLKTNCSHCVVIAGNHDSPSMLGAPKELLDILNIKVISNVSDSLEDEVIEIKNQNDEIQAVVAAVPFLRDRDLKSAIAEEGIFEKTERIKEGIYQHYREIANLCEKYKKIPVIATGHLFAKGAQASDKQDNIYIGNMENISSEQFSEVFDYVALGHIHRAQSLDEKKNIRYSGSILPLSFSEIQDRKSVTIIEFEGKKIKKIEEKDIPSVRKLVMFRGNLEEVKDKLAKFNAKLLLQKETETKLRAWVEIQIETENIIPNLEQQLADFTKNMFLDILKIRAFKVNQVNLTPTYFQQNLEDMTELDVFKKRLENVEESAHKELILSFTELLEQIKQAD